MRSHNAVPVGPASTASTTLRKIRLLFASACVVLMCAGTGRTQELRKLSGVVSDSAGAPISGASIEFRSTGNGVRTTSDSEGHFTVSSDVTAGVLLISSPGFQTLELKVGDVSTSDVIEIRLEPAPVIERLEVNQGDERISAASTSQFSIPKREIEVAGAITVDDLLRQVPGFSLFRRAGSLAANPTSQGVSLRGVGANGASRALVYLDGVPLNNPFGGWVYWNRVSRTSIEGVDTYSGATSDLYGSGALGGVINLKSLRFDRKFFGAETSIGNQSTQTVSASGGKFFGGWGIMAGFQGLHTDGYIIVPADQRGTVDTPAATAYIAGSITLSRNLPGDGRAFVRVNLFGESRKNGTPLQLNDTRISSIDLGSDWSQGRAGDFSVRLYGSSELFNQTFSAVAADRNSESLTNRQRNPSQQLGMAFQWRVPVSHRQMITAGIEGRDIRGHSAEATFAGSRITAHLDAGGRQRFWGLFAQDSLQAQSWFFTLGARLDRWVNTEGFSNRIPLNGASSLNSFRDRSETALSPRFSMWRRFEGGLALGGSIYRAFRAPTLNELYRGFRVGNVVTSANANLEAERLTGGEAGMTLTRFSERLTVRTNLFWSDIQEPIANVTLTTTPTLINRQRQNLGAIRAQGIEVDGSFKFANDWQISSEYLLTSSKVLRFPINQSLEGLMVPQVPRNQLNFQISYAHEVWTAGVQGRFVGKQFDDDQNTFTLDRFFSVDAEISRRLSKKLKLFVAAQNLTGVRYEVSKTPVTTVGPPRLIRLGARLKL